MALHWSHVQYLIIWSGTVAKAMVYEKNVNLKYIYKR